MEKEKSFISKQTRYEPCPECNGTGMIEDTEGEGKTRICYNCDGNGNVRVTKKINQTLKITPMIERIYYPQKSKLIVLVKDKFIFGAHGSVAKSIYERFVKNGETVSIDT